jgi:hypothetical protein
MILYKDLWVHGFLTNREVYQLIEWNWEDFWVHGSSSIDKVKANYH